MTLEELQQLIALRQAQTAPDSQAISPASGLPASAPPPVPPVDPAVAATATAPDVEPVQMPNPTTLNSEPPLKPTTIPDMPTNPADPYNKAAEDYSSKASALETTAATPMPQPHGAKEQLVNAARAALENFGKFGAPGGYAGQEQQRLENFTARQQRQLAQAKEFRGLADTQQHLGETAKYDQERIQELQQLRSQQIADAAEKLREFNATQETEKARLEQEKNKPVLQGPGQILKNPVTGDPIGASVPEKKPVEEKEMEDWILKHPTTNGHLSGPSDFNEYNKKIAPTTTFNLNNPQAAPTTVKYLADQIAKDPTGWNLVSQDKTLADQVRTELANRGVDVSKLGAQATAKISAKEDQDYQTSMASVGAMEKLAAQNSYAADQALGDQFFNVVKPGTGARMSQPQINRFMSPGPLKDKLLVIAQKLDQGQPLDPAAREALIDAARAVAESKLHSGAAQPAAAGGLPKVGETFNGAKVLKVTPIP